MEWISSEVYDGIQKLDFSPGDEFKISYWENVVALQIWPQAGINGKHKDSIAREKFEGDLTEISQWKLPNAEVWFLERSLNSRQKQWESVATTAEILMIQLYYSDVRSPFDCQIDILIWFLWLWQLDHVKEEVDRNPYKRWKQ